MSLNFPVVDPAIGSSYSLGQHLFILTRPSGSPSSVQLLVVQCPRIPGNAVVVVATHTLNSHKLIALNVGFPFSGPTIYINEVNYPSDPPDIEAVIAGSTADAIASIRMYENKTDLGFFLGTDDQRADCLSTNPGSTSHTIYTQIILSKADLALGFESSTGALQIYYRLLPGTTGGYTRFFERFSL
jgi:hypothetical protein